MEQPTSFWKKYGLGILLVALFVVAWILMTWSSWANFVADQHQHHESAQVFGPSGYIWQWGVDTFSNWQADLLWEGLTIVLAAYLIFQGSSQSRDSSDRIEQMALDIERRVRGESPASQDQARTSADVYRGGWWRNRGLAYAMLGAGIISWALMTWMGWNEFAAQQQQHHETAQVLGASGYVWYWARVTLENWQSEILGHAALVILPAYLLYKDSAESRDSDDKVEQALQRVQQALQGNQPQPAAATHGTVMRESQRRHS